MQICESWLLTWYRSPVFISSCLALPRSPAVAPNSTVPWLFLSWPNNCLTPRTWWLPVILVMVATSQWLPYSVGECPWKKLTNRCWTSRTRTVLTLSSGFQTMWRLLFVTSHLEVWRCLEPSLVTVQPSKNSSNESVSSSQLCSGEKLSSIGTLVKEWTKWNSLRYVTCFVCYGHEYVVKKLSLWRNLK